MTTLRQAIPFVVGVVIYWACLAGSQQTFSDTWFYRAGPGVDPPWYFIGSDAVRAMWCAAGASALVIFSLAAARKVGAVVWLALAAILISFADPIGRGVNILLHTRNLWDRNAAASDWPTFDVYIRSQSTASNISLAVGMVVAVMFGLHYRREFKKEL